jgi:hypothetical protein
MEELIFFAVIIFFSIVESIVRSRRAKRGEVEGQGEGEGGGDVPLPDSDRMERYEPRSRTPDVEHLPTYDADPSYDDLATSGGRGGRRDQPTPMRGDGRVEERGRPSSEMLSADLLEELAEMASRRSREGEGGRRRPRPVRVPRQSPPLPEPVREGPPVTRLPVKATEIGEHAVHRSHAEYGTDPSSRRRSEQDVMYAPKDQLDADAAAVRRQLLSHSTSSLRQAIILQEVLGPPVAMRESDDTRKM